VKKLFSLIILVACCSDAFPTDHDEQVAYFCPSCTDQTSARQRALALAASPNCDYGVPPQLPPISCQDTIRRVILGNHISGQKFAFLVTTDEMLASSVESDSLTTVERDLIDTIFQLRADWAGIDWHQTVEDGTIQAGTMGRISLYTEYATQQTSGGSDCPVGTALDHVLNPALQAPLKDAITFEVMNRLSEYQGMNPRVRRLTGVGVTAPSGAGLSLQWENPDERTFQASYGFPVSEVDSGLTDVLVYDVELRGEHNGQPLLHIGFDDQASRAAGAIVRDLLNGAATITISDECVLEKLEAFNDAENGSEIRVGGPGGDPFDFSGLSSGDGGAALCSKILCATVCSVDSDGNKTGCECQFEFAVLAPCDL